MKKVFMAAAILFCFTQCNNGSRQTTPAASDTLSAKDTATNTKASDTASATADQAIPGDFKPTKTYTADKADLHEQLRVQVLSDKKIAYEVKMENGECAETIFRGVATLKEGDAESDTDEKGNGYFVAEYMDEQKGQCTVFIRLGADEGYTNRARFSLADCAKACKSKTESETLFLQK